MPTASSFETMSHSPSQPSTSTCFAGPACSAGLRALVHLLLLLPPMMPASSLSKLLSAANNEPAMVLVLLLLLLCGWLNKEGASEGVAALKSPLLDATAEELLNSGSVRVTASGSAVNPSGTAPAAGAEGRAQGRGHRALGSSALSQPAAHPPLLHTPGQEVSKLSKLCALLWQTEDTSCAHAPPVWQGPLSQASPKPRLRERELGVG